MHGCERNYYNFIGDQTDYEHIALNAIILLGGSIMSHYLYVRLYVHTKWVISDLRARFRFRDSMPVIGSLYNTYAVAFFREISGKVLAACFACR